MQQELSDFIESVKTIRSYPAKFITALFECTPFQVVSELLSKFENGETILKLPVTDNRGRPNNRYNKYCKFCVRSHTPTVDNNVKPGAL